MELPLLKELVVIFCLSMVVIYACSQIKIPPIVGFLITGVVCGPYGLGLVNAIEQVEVLSEVGVVLLMFSIGMELSITELIRLRKPVFMGGGLQVGLTIGIFACVALSVGQSLGTGIFIGFLAALSSTAIVLKVLQQQAQMDSPQGRISLSILIAQDLVVVPMMLAIPLLAGVGVEDSDPVALLLSTLKTLGIIGAVFFLARKLVPLALGLVIRTRSRELFLIATLGVCLSIAFVTSRLGLSLSLGAFLAGLIVSESEYSHSALEGVLPFKDVFTSIFFTSVGMLLNLGFFVTHVGQVLLICVALLFLKAIAAATASRLLGYPLRTSVIAGLALCQIGEFSFVLAKAGLDVGLLTANNYQRFLAASILTMAATPFLLMLAPKIAAGIDNSWRRLRGYQTIVCMDDPVIAASEFHDHLIIIGFGIGGKYLARAAKMAGIQYVILEMNPDTVRKYAAKGEPIRHGDATHPAVLTGLGIHHARILAIVISDPAAARSVTDAAHRLASGVHILARTRFLEEMGALKKLGASDVIPEDLETAVEIFIRVLSRYLIPRASIEHFVNEVRTENYEVLRSSKMPETSFSSLEKQIPDFNVAALDVEEASRLDGATLQDAHLRRTANITIVAVRRGAELISNPDGAFKLQAGDVAYVFGTADDLVDAVPLFSLQKHAFSAFTPM